MNGLGSMVERAIQEGSACADGCCTAFSGGNAHRQIHRKQTALLKHIPPADDLCDHQIRHVSPPSNQIPFCKKETTPKIVSKLNIIPINF